MTDTLMKKTKSADETPRAETIVLGLGNVLHSDDGAGPALADLISAEKSQSITAFNCGTAPENFTGVVRKLHPRLLIIADASLMNMQPGTLRKIPADKIADTAVGTHMLPLSHLIEYLREDADEIIMIGIQPENLNDGDELSPEVLCAVEQLKTLILSGKTDTIPLY